MNITVKIPLVTSERKEQKLQKLIEREEELAEFFSERIYSFPIQNWGGQPSKGMRNLPKKKDGYGRYGKNGLASSHYKNALFRHINDMYANMRDGVIEEPGFSEMDYAILCSCGTPKEGTINRKGCELAFDLENEGVKIPLLDEEDEKDWFSMRLGDYHRKLFEKAEGIGSTPRIIEVDGRYELHQPLILPDKEPDYQPETMVGVDFNFDRLAVACFINKDGGVETVQFNDYGRQIRDYRERHRDKRRELQEKGLNQRVEEDRNKVDRMTENTLHTVAKNIVDQAQEMKKPAIKIEDTGIQEMRQQVNKEQNKNWWKSTLNRWAVGRLIEFLEYKAEKEGVLVEKINPRNTSKECHKCSEVGRRPSQRDFYCQNEGCDNYESRIDADMNAALNIAKR